MGTSTDAYLMYGYDLGSDEGWKIQNLGEYDDWEPEWLDEDKGIEESAIVKLRQAAGFTETDYQVGGFFDRREAIDAQIGVEIEAHCSGEYPMYVLTAKTLRASRGDVEVVDFAALQEAVVAEDLDGKLERALDVLGFRPTQGRPAWLLCSYWG